MKIYNRSDDDIYGDEDLEANDNQRRRHSNQRVSLIRTISCSNNQNGTGNNNRNILMNNLQNRCDEGLNGEGAVSNSLLPENTQISTLSNGPPSYNDLRGSFQNVNENEDPPSYDDVRLPSS